jgi:hypothetical protein
MDRLKWLTLCVTSVLVLFGCDFFSESSPPKPKPPPVIIKSQLRLDVDMGQSNGGSRIFMDSASYTEPFQVAWPSCNWLELDSQQMKLSGNKYYAGVGEMFLVATHYSGKTENESLCWIRFNVQLENIERFTQLRAAFTQGQKVLWLEKTADKYYFYVPKISGLISSYGWSLGSLGSSATYNGDASSSDTIYVALFDTTKALPNDYKAGLLSDFILDFGAYKRLLLDNDIDFKGWRN